jgi:hypothetical protein
MERRKEKKCAKKKSLTLFEALIVGFGETPLPENAQYLQAV